MPRSKELRGTQDRPSLEDSTRYWNRVEANQVMRLASSKAKFGKVVPGGKGGTAESQVRPTRRLSIRTVVWGPALSDDAILNRMVDTEFSLLPNAPAALRRENLR